MTLCEIVAGESGWKQIEIFEDGFGMGRENSPHYVLDMAFRENECRMSQDEVAENFTVLRHSCGSGRRQG